MEEWAFVDDRDLQGLKGACVHMTCQHFCYGVAQYSAPFSAATPDSGMEECSFVDDRELQGREEACIVLRG